MEPDANSAETRRRCHWCKSDCEGYVCTVCKGPRGWMLVPYLANKFAVIAIVPICLTLATNWFSVRQEKIALQHATHDKLLKSYSDIATTLSDYHQAFNNIDFLASTTEHDVDASELRKAVLELNKAFDAVGAELTPFEDVEKSVTSGNSSPLHDFWHRCFIENYYATPGPWVDTGRKLAQCGQKNCQSDIARQVRDSLNGVGGANCNSGPTSDNGGHGNGMNAIWGKLDCIIIQQNPPPSPSILTSIMHFLKTGDYNPAAISNCSQKLSRGA